MCNNNSASVRKQVVAVNVKPRRRITSVNLLILQTNALPPTSTFDKVCPAFQIKSQQLVACCYFVAMVALLLCCLFLPGLLPKWFCVSEFENFDVTVCFNLYNFWCGSVFQSLTICVSLQKGVCVAVLFPGWQLHYFLFVLLSRASLLVAVVLKIMCLVSLQSWWQGGATWQVFTRRLNASTALLLGLRSHSGASGQWEREVAEEDARIAQQRAQLLARVRVSELTHRCSLIAI